MGQVHSGVAIESVVESVAGSLIDSTAFRGSFVFPFPLRRESCFWSDAPVAFRLRMRMDIAIRFF
jgi:hypothetical protein